MSVVDQVPSLSKALSSIPRITEKMKKEKNTREREREISLKYHLIKEDIKLIVFLMSSVLFFFLWWVRALKI